MTERACALTKKPCEKKFPYRCGSQGDSFWESLGVVTTVCPTAKDGLIDLVNSMAGVSNIDNNVRGPNPNTAVILYTDQKNKRMATEIRAGGLDTF